MALGSVGCGGRRAATTEPMYGQSSAYGVRLLPERQKRRVGHVPGQVVVVAGVVVVGVDSPVDRTDDQRQVMCLLGQQRQVLAQRTPGAEVAIGWNGPRYSTGASGFMSHMSMCDAPPHRKNRIVDLARPPVVSAAGAAAARCGLPNCRPANPTPEATRNVRRGNCLMAL